MPTALLCPEATPEWLQVEPAISPTGALSQIITVRMSNMQAVTVTAESGVFTSAGPSGQVRVALLPDTEHHLEVTARVGRIQNSDGCLYGGYTLRTRQDKNGLPLVIQQGRPRSPDGSKSLITAENVPSLKPLFALTPNARLTTDFSYRGSDEIISVGYASRISVWSLITGQETGWIGEGLEQAAALCVVVHPAGSQIATGGTAADPAVRLWTMVTGEMVELGLHEAHLTSVAFNPSGTRLASGDNANRVWIWDLATGQALAGFEGDLPNRLQAFGSLYWFNDQILLAAGTDVVYWWDVTTGQILERLTRPERAAFLVDLSVSPVEGSQAEVLAAAAQDDAVYVWEPETRRWAIWPAFRGARVSNVEFSPDGQLLAAGTLDGELLLWSVQGAQLLASYSVTTGSIAAVHFSPDGRNIAVGGWDSPIWLWGVP
jgi:WD40 repeat protein